MLQPLQKFLNKWGMALPICAVLGLGAVGVYAIREFKEPVIEHPDNYTPAPISALIAANNANPAANKNATVVLELFNPSDESLTHQLNDTTVRQQIEQVMATSFVLFNCKLIKSKDYQNNYLALIVLAQRNKLARDQKDAETKVNEIAKAAGASYGLLYSRTRCDDPKLPGIAQQLIDWQKQYLR